MRAFRLGGELDYLGDLSDYLDLESLLTWVQGDLLDETPQNRERLVAGFGNLERIVEAGHLLAVNFGQVRMQEGCGCVRVSQLLLQYCLPLLQLLQLGIQARH